MHARHSIAALGPALSLALALAPRVAAEDSGIEVSRPSFTAFHEFGRFEKALFENYSPIESQWVHRSGAWVNFTAHRNERLGLDLLVGGVYYIPTYQQPSELPSKIRYFAGSVPRMDVSYLFGPDPKKPFLRLDGGVFNYKYNENARNLGEYLYRTGTYPGWISTGAPGGITYLDAAMAQLTGLKASQGFGMFSHDLLLNLETDIIPTFDVNLAYMAKLDLGGVLKLQAGAQFARILPAKPSKTNPDIRGNRYYQYQGKWYTDKKNYYLLLQQGADNAADSALYGRSAEIADSLGNGTLTASESGHYSASGIKPVAAFAFDPKPLFGNPEILGPNDLTLYGEAAVLGIKDYPVLYDDVGRRIPFMLGFNIPAFRILDVLAFEIEHYGSRFPNSTSEVQSSGIPLPTIPTTADDFRPADWSQDDWKWSLFAKRKVFEGFTVVGQVARDHARGYEYPTGKDYYTLFRKSDQWYWLMKLVVNI
jgi:hypothetical protein